MAYNFYAVKIHFLRHCGYISTAKASENTQLFHFQPQDEFLPPKNESFVSFISLAPQIFLTVVPLLSLFFYRISSQLLEIWRWLEPSSDKGCIRKRCSQSVCNFCGSDRPKSLLFHHDWTFEMSRFYSTSTILCLNQRFYNSGCPVSIILFPLRQDTSIQKN